MFSLYIRREMVTFAEIVDLFRYGRQAFFVGNLISQNMALGTI